MHDVIIVTSNYYCVNLEEGVFQSLNRRLFPVIRENRRGYVILVFDDYETIPKGSAILLRKRE